MKEGESLLEAMARTGAREMLAHALEDEIRHHLEKYKGLRDEEGRKLVVRNSAAEWDRFLAMAVIIFAGNPGRKR
ncbi:MAG: hypothetical protein JXD23_02805 [Spirochaetales bacterium]|nr:hypothetical protein [Spirochaetales bacterium]